MEYELLGWPPDGPTLRLDYTRFSYAGKFVMTNTGKAIARESVAADNESEGDESEGDESGGDESEDDESEGGESTDVEDHGTDKNRNDGNIDDETDWDDDIVAAVAFNEDRTDENTLWLRYVTVAKDRRGEGIGPQLCRLVRDRAIERGYGRLKIAVNNPFAYEALYRTGFADTGDRTGIAELVLEYPRPATLEDEGENGDTARERYQDGLEEFRERDLSEAEEEFLESRRGEAPPEPESDRR